MGFQKGHKLSPGRPHGSKNKRTNLFAICEEMGIDVFKEMVTMAVMEVDPEKRFSKMRDIAPYLYAKQKESTHIIENMTFEEALEIAEEKAKENGLGTSGAV